MKQQAEATFILFFLSAQWQLLTEFCDLASSLRQNYEQASAVTDPHNKIKAVARA